MKMMNLPTGLISKNKNGDWKNLQSPLFKIVVIN